ncbi:MAG: DUF6468 domain-containing protein [Phenylobacterium sp.]|jgi:hypothetical protein|uniref:DUF6468 domain-containing protein n=1 Tax=Brevundimonas mediterranea TaxID=74329 RepID=A0AB37E4J5_9CAUL|nr:MULTISPECIES: DUF6468 domain-containing protein [Brevundimonas]MDZ4371621.1 DUF6468 domain-containing protein [Phenylobacterium sp.]OGN48334.1 MAG: hypothetical protein A3E24_07255 [Caulobacterales bacterium RIFCSPHIGHO2_12_FULL_68_13]OYX81305.1 MAG: hypothetical protein B7Y85_02100 [Brevundimonas sp. 32-68-21]PZO04971.1 MAG: hypothetical protein DCF29_09380 [Alphaproteobacteria bacterium]EDX79195.1 hypothetical protein BBAL3_352 [Brevundimonas sp. BAL3]
MTGMIMDAVLMLLLVAAVGYGIKLERKLSALRTGQVAFAQAVTELNAAAGRAEAALATLRASGQETDLLHDRIIKAREVKQQLEALIARAPVAAPLRLQQEETAPRPEIVRPVASAPSPAAVVNDDDERARRMAALAQRIQGMSGPAATSRAGAPAGRDNVAAIVQALTSVGSANHSAKQSLNAARRNLDDDLFAA